MYYGKIERIISAEVKTLEPRCVKSRVTVSRDQANVMGPDLSPVIVLPVNPTYVMPCYYMDKIEIKGL